VKWTLHRVADHLATDADMGAEMRTVRLLHMRDTVGTAPRNQIAAKTPQRFDGAHGHLCNRIAQATGSEELADLARVAYRRGLAARAPGTGIGGFTQIARGPKSADPRFAPSLQLGATGVALGLLAATTAVAPDWDRAFLMTLPPRG